MKLKNSQDIKLESKNNKVINAKIDPSAMTLIMDMLAKNYNNPLPSAIREYVSNGIDVHKEQHINKPVKLTLPNHFSDEIIIEDFGCGLSLDEIINIYANFGSSTKRNDDEQIGGFGIGSKSGLAISNMITVTSVKNGLKNIFTLVRDETGISTILLKENEKTDDDSGTTVQIPFRALEEYEKEEIASELNGWSKEDVIVSDNNPLYNDFRIPDIGEKFNNGYLIPQKYHGMVKTKGKYNAIIGGVLYPIDIRKIITIMDTGEINLLKHFTFEKQGESNIVITIPIEDAYVSYSRENIDENEKMLENCKKYMLRMLNELKKHIEKEIESKQNIYQVIKTLDQYHLYQKWGVINNILWKDKTIEDYCNEYKEKHKDNPEEFTLIEKTGRNIYIYIRSKKEQKKEINTIKNDYNHRREPVILTKEMVISNKNKTKLREFAKEVFDYHKDISLKNKKIDSKVKEKINDLRDVGVGRHQIKIIHTKNSENYVYKDEILTLEELLPLLPEPEKAQKTYTACGQKPAYRYEENKRATRLEVDDIPKGSYVAYEKDIPIFKEKITQTNFLYNFKYFLPPLYVVRTKQSFEYAIKIIGAIPFDDESIHDIIKERVNKKLKLIKYTHRGDIKFLELINYYDTKKLFKHIGINTNCNTLQLSRIIRYLNNANESINRIPKEYKDKLNIDIKTEAITPELTIISSWRYYPINEKETAIQFVDIFKDRFPQIKERIETLYDLYEKGEEL